MEEQHNQTLLKVSRRDFFEEWRRWPKEERKEKLVEFLWNKFIENGQTEAQGKQELSLQVSRYSSRLDKRWKESRYRLEVFNKMFSTWLEGEDFEFNCSQLDPESNPLMDVDEQPSGGPGRKPISFTHSSEKTKKRKVQPLLQYDSEQIAHAAHLSLYASGNRKAASIVKNIVSDTPAEREDNQGHSSRSLTPDEALGLLIDCKLSKSSYIHLRKRAMDVGHTLYPPYHLLQEHKKLCYVPGSEFTVTENRVEATLQSVLDLTIQRLSEVQKPVLLQLIEAGHREFVYFCKWGCDGSSGHSSYKQKFEKEENDDFLFLYAFVPLNLTVKNNRDIIAWNNRAPGSTTNCRPIKFIMAKESTALIINETKAIEAEIASLEPCIVRVGETSITVTYNCILTMVDGKVCNALTGTKSTSTCYICGCTPKQRKNLERPLPVLSDTCANYSFGLSPLHAWIRSLEFFLQLAYKLDIKHWPSKGQEDKNSKEERKSRIQKQFKLQTGLNIDKPKQGFGNTNDGNTARRFFKDSAVTASITGLDETLLRRFRVILQCLSCGYHINVDAFERYAEETKLLYMHLYSWYPLPVTIHKLLEHSSEIIKSHLVPIGHLSEEAQEARNKDCRRYRLFNTRKHSRLSTNRDLFNMLLLSSDPVVVNFRKRSQKKSAPYDSEVLSLISPHPDILTPSQPIEVRSRHENLDSCSSDTSDSD